MSCLKTSQQAFYVQFWRIDKEFACNCDDPHCWLVVLFQVLALVQKVQESETLLTTLQQAFSQAKRHTQEQMVSTYPISQPAPI